MRLADARRDHYRRLAKDQGYRSRAAYKLKQIDDSYHILKKGHKIVDIGCAPGGWIQVAVKEVGSGGKVVGIDIKEVEPVFGATILQGSIDDPVAVAKIIDALGEKADLVLSDLAPNVSGMWEVDHARQIDLTRSALAFAQQVLKKNNDSQQRGDGGGASRPGVSGDGGNAVFKVFEGEFLAELKTELKSIFSKVLVSKPTASRQESSEMYLVCLGIRT